jgi:HK97 family phage prohead protease
VKQNSDGTLDTIACHDNKQDAIDQMVAVSLAEGIEPIGEVNTRAEVDLSAPKFMRESARRGLELHEQGLSGDGLMPATVADARRMSAGEISENKWRKIGAWISRHISDLDAVDGNEITAGLVAMLLWGGGSTKTSALRTQRYAENIVARLDGEDTRDMDENEALIVDIDDTLLRAGNEPMQDVIDAVNSSGYAVYIVTGRDESRRAETEQTLADAGVMYVDLIMQPADSTDTAEFKKQAATELVNSGVLIGAAVDNDQANLDAYASIGIETYTPEAFVADQAEDVVEEQPMVEDNGSERSASDVYAGGDMNSTVQWVSGTLDERRSVAYTTLEMRASEDGNVFTGYAAVFDSPSEPMPFIEYVRKGAFTKTLKDGADVRLLIDHEGVPLARTKSGTLTLEEDERGLRVEASLDPMNPDAQRVISAMKRGDLSQMSFAFRTIKDAFSADGMVRELREVQLFDVSVVTYPAYEDTIAELRRSQPVSVVPSGSLLARQRQIQIARHR